MSWSNPNNFNIFENQLCPPYPECIEDYVGYQDTSECVPCSELNGDINNDHEVNILDIMIVVNSILSDIYDDCSDLNYDGNVDVLDIMIMVNLVLDN